MPRRIIGERSATIVWLEHEEDEGGEEEEEGDERKLKHSKDSKEDEQNAEHQVTTIQNYKINGELWRRQTGIVGFWPKSQRNGQTNGRMAK